MGKYTNKILMSIFALVLSALFVGMIALTCGETGFWIILPIAVLGNIYSNYRTFVTNKDENLN